MVNPTLSRLNKYRYLMKKKTKQLLIFALCTPPLVIALIAGGVFIKIKYDFPANKHGHQQLQEETGVSISNTKVFYTHTGWTDSQHYFRFTANTEEIDHIVKSRGLIMQEAGRPQRLSYYWWKPNMKDRCEHYAFSDGALWADLYYYPESGDTYFFWTTI